MAARNYSSTATSMALTANVAGVDTNINVDTTGGLPAAPFTLVIEPGTMSEEIVTCTGVAGSILTVVRAQEGTAAVSHLSGTTVRHKATGRDFQESRDHEAATSGVHGLSSGNVVGTSQAQTLTNKTMSGASNTFSSIPQSAVVDLVADTAEKDAHIAATAAHGATGAVVGTTNTQTLSNKTINTASNTITVEKKDVSDRYYFVAYQTSDDTIGAGLTTSVSYTILNSNGSWPNDGLSFRRIIPKTGLYRVHAYATWAASGAVANQRILFREANADGSSLGTLKGVGNATTGGDTNTTCEATRLVRLTAGKCLVVQVDNNHTTSFTTLGGFEYGGYSLEYVGP